MNATGELPVHGRGEGWSTACGLDRANVSRWTLITTEVTCYACRSATPDADDASTGASEPLSEDGEALTEVIDGEVYCTVVIRSEHHSNCPGGGPDCAHLCPVPVQDYGDTKDLAAAILASDWLAAHVAAARAEGAAEAWDEGLATGVRLAEQGFASPNPYRAARTEES